MDMKGNFGGFFGEFDKPDDGSEYTLEQYRAYLRSFNVDVGLISISMLSMEGGFKPNRVNGSLICDSILSFIVMHLIDASNDSIIKKKMTKADVMTIHKMWFGLDFYVEGENEKAFIRRFTNWQFNYQRKVQYSMPRAILIYKYLWEKCRKSSHIDIKTEIKNCMKLSLDDLLIIGNVFCGQAINNGYITIDPLNLNLSQEYISKVFTIENQRTFIDKFSCTFKQFREKILELNCEKYFTKMPPKSIELTKVNPLRDYPIIIPERDLPAEIHQTHLNLMHRAKKIFLLPIPRMLYDAITCGLYFSLKDHLERRKINFTSLFGNVFEDYVGDILLNTLSEIKILPEWNYSTAKKRILMTPDWIIIKEKKAIIIEVKSSTIFKQSKTTGDEATILDDISITVAPGVKKLIDFENDVKSNRFEGLKCLASIEEFERMIITYDDSYFANSDIRDRVKDVLSKKGINLPENFHWHSLSISEFEPLIGVFGNILFSFLSKKRLDSDGDRWSFRNYWYQNYPDVPHKNEYLDKVTNTFMKDIRKSQS